MRNLEDIPLSLRLAIQKLAAEYAPEEICGLIVERKSDGKLVLVHSLNVHKKPQVAFALSEKCVSLARQIGEAKVLYHSHTNACPRFSETDIYQIESMTSALISKGQPPISWYLYDTQTGAELLHPGSLEKTGAGAEIFPCEL